MWNTEQLGTARDHMAAGSSQAGALGMRLEVPFQDTLNFLTGKGNVKSQHRGLPCEIITRIFCPWVFHHPLMVWGEEGMQPCWTRIRGLAVWGRDRELAEVLMSWHRWKYV